MLKQGKTSIKVLRGFYKSLRGLGWNPKNAKRQKETCNELCYSSVSRIICGGGIVAFAGSVYLTSKNI